MSPTETEAVLHYIPLARKLAWGFMCPSSISRDDLLSEAYVGLIDGVTRHGDKSGAELTNYLVIRIRGQIKDYLRKFGDMSRSNNPEKRTKYSFFHLSAMIHTDSDGHTLTLEDVLPDRRVVMPGRLQEDKDFIDRAIGILNVQEREVIRRYYYEHLTLKNISTIFGVTESRIGQVRTEAIDKMRLYAIATDS